MSIVSKPLVVGGIQQYNNWTRASYSLNHVYEGAVLRRVWQGSFTTDASSSWLILEGQAVVTSQEKSITARPGQWVFVGEPTRHQNFSPGTRILSVNFYIRWPDGTGVIPNHENRMVEAAAFPELEKTARALLRLRTQVFPGVETLLRVEPCTITQYLAVQNLLPHWLNAYLEAQASLGVFPSRDCGMDQRIRTAAALLDRHPWQVPFSVRELLARVQMGRSQFDTLFLASLGCTPKRYLDNRRKREARELIEHETLSLKEIAFRLGFRHASHFSGWFRKQFGTSPRQWLREHRTPRT